MTRPAAALATVGDALADQATAVVTWLEQLGPDDFAAPTGLGDWDVRMLVAHLVVVAEGLVSTLDEEVPRGRAAALSASAYVQRYRPAAEWIAARTAQRAGEADGPALVERLRGSPDPRAALAGRSAAAVVEGARGPTTVLDWARTRLVELVVHADDLSRALPDRPAVVPPRAALADATRLLATALADQAPGRSVEIRVPPFVAVQAVPGPRHTRGTPPNVVEADPTVWLRLATGRVSFAAAVTSGDVRATGPRSDLTPYLPVLA